MNSADSQQRFQDALWHSTISTVFDKLSKKNPTLLSLDEVLQVTKSKNKKYIGVSTILVKDIIGSEGRFDDFNHNFLPKKSALKTRWTKIDTLYAEGKILPPITAYKIGQYYFVRDGNHRVSVAKSRGQEYIDAEVTEYQLKVPITKEMTVKDRILIQEHNHFLEATGLLEHVHLAADINLTQPEFYQNLFEIIQQYTQLLNQNEKTSLTVQQGTIRWYKQVFLPFAEDAYLNDVLSKFPKRTTGDLYVWLQLHWQELKQNIRTEFDYLGGLPTKTQAKEPHSAELKLLSKVLMQSTHRAENVFLHGYIGICVANVLLHINPYGNCKAVLVKRKYHPYERRWSLPIAMMRKEETMYQAAARCFHNVLGLSQEIHLHHFVTNDQIDRHPLGRILAFGMLAVYYGKDIFIKAGDAASEVSLQPLNQVPELVFDHNHIIQQALKYLLKSQNQFSVLQKIFPPEMPIGHVDRLLTHFSHVVHK